MLSALHWWPSIRRSSIRCSLILANLGLFSLSAKSLPPLLRRTGEFFDLPLNLLNLLFRKIAREENESVVPPLNPSHLCGVRILDDKSKAARIHHPVTLGSHYMHRHLGDGQLSECFLIVIHQSFHVGDLFSGFAFGVIPEKIVHACCNQNHERKRHE